MKHKLRSFPAGAGIALFALAVLGCSEEIQGAIGEFFDAGTGGRAEDSGGLFPGADTGNWRKDGGGSGDGGEGPCSSGTSRACYDGPAETRGKGACRDGTEACVGGAWQACTGQVLPAAGEECNKRDDDCDGEVDEGCSCKEGDEQACYTGPAGTEGKGLCKGGTQGCEGGFWGGCEGEVLPEKEDCAGVPEGNPPPDADCDGKPDPAIVNKCGVCGPAPKEVCGNDLDDDCDGSKDEGCDCPDGATKKCYSGPEGTEGKGICRAGKQTCEEGKWGTCEGETVPKPEICDNLMDENCDGVFDDNCPCKEGTEQGCYTGPAGTEGVGTCKGGTSTCTGGAYGQCKGQVTPLPETCSGVPAGTLPPDTDCNGKPNTAILNKCGLCGPELPEVCGNGRDDNCDGAADEGCDCNADCQCSGGACECKPRYGQPCYEGPVQAMGKGICVSGLRDCVESGGAWKWTECIGDVMPVAEVCDDGLDNDCDGYADDGCNPDQCNPETGEGCVVVKECEDFQERACYTGPAETRGVGECRDGVERCAGNKWTGACEGEIKPSGEACDGKDNDCNNQRDENCSCTSGQTRACWTGPLPVVFKADNGKSICVKGTQTCGGDGVFGECNNMTLPVAETCGDKADNDCDGYADEFCDCAPGQERFCYSGPNGTRGVGICRDGIETCGIEGWSGSCRGQVLPEAEQCGDGLDNDCNGLTDDVVNACGKCGEPCYEEHYDEPGNCGEPGRSCNGTEPDPSDPGSITLGEAQLNAPFIYIAQYEVNRVAKLDTATGARLWEVPSGGTYPSRTAVAFDYSVWVANRGFNDPNDPNSSNVVHLDLDGNLICRADVTGIARGLAIDAYGYVWAGTWNTTRVYKIDGTIVDQTPNGPRCRVEAVYDVGVSIYGLAVDGRGFLYACSLPSILKLDTSNGTFVNNIPLSACYGVAVSPKDGRVWYGSYHNTGCVNGMDPDPPYAKQVTSVGCGGIISGVTVDHEGYVWASSYANGYVYKIDPATGQQVCSALSPCTPGASSGCDARGVAEDAAGKIWVVNLGGGYANRYTRDCSRDATFEVHDGVRMYTYSDMTGMQLRTVTTREGHWVQDFDSGYASPVWYRAEWTATANPPDTGVEISFKAADTAGGLQSNPTATCGPFQANQSPADLTTCPFLSGHRWLEADVKLWTKKDGVRPKFSDLKIFWARP